MPAFTTPPPARRWQKEISLGAFAALIGRRIVDVRGWLEAGLIPGRKTYHLGRWRVCADYARRVANGAPLPDGSHAPRPEASP